MMRGGCLLDGCSVVRGGYVLDGSSMVRNPRTSCFAQWPQEVGVQPSVSQDEAGVHREGHEQGGGRGARQEGWQRSSREVRPPVEPRPALAGTVRGRIRTLEAFCWGSVLSHLAGP